MVSLLHVISSQVAVQALITRTSLGRFNPCLIFIENASWNQVVCHAKIINESRIYDSVILSFQQLYTSFSFCMNLPQTGGVDWTSAMNQINAFDLERLTIWACPATRLSTFENILWGSPTTSFPSTITLLIGNISGLLLLQSQSFFWNADCLVQQL